MEKLKGKTILIGREPINSRLRIALDGKIANIGQMHSVPDCVSRCVPAEGKAHCSITIDTNGRLKIKNLKSANTTCVNGVQVIEKSINLQDTLSLGCDGYIISVQTIIETAKKFVTAESPDLTFSLRPLESVWNQYDKDILDMQVEQAKAANRSRLIGILSMSSMFLMFIPLEGGFISTCRPILIGGALLFSVYLYWQGRNLFVLKKRERDAQFAKEYVCPNPECDHYKGPQPYNTLKTMTMCPVCKCKYTA